MSEELILGLARDAISTMLLMAAPILVISLAVGLGISIFQATTQIQEPTLTFVPKIVAVALVILFFGPWMLNTLVEFALRLFGDMSFWLR